MFKSTKQHTKNKSLVQFQLNKSTEHPNKKSMDLQNIQALMKRYQEKFNPIQQNQDQRKMLQHIQKLIQNQKEDKRLESQKSLSQSKKYTHTPPNYSIQYRARNITPSKVKTNCSTNVYSSQKNQNSMSSQGDYLSVKGFLQSEQAKTPTKTKQQTPNKLKEEENQFSNISTTWNQLHHTQSDIARQIQGTMFVLDQMRNKDQQPNLLDHLNIQLTRLMIDLNVISESRRKVQQITSLAQLEVNLKESQSEQEMLAKGLSELLLEVRDINQIIQTQMGKDQQNTIQMFEKQVAQLIKDKNLIEEQYEKVTKAPRFNSEKKSNQSDNLSIQLGSEIKYDFQKQESKPVQSLNKPNQKERETLKLSIMDMQDQMKQMALKNKKLISLVLAIKQRGFDVETVYQKVDQEVDDLRSSVRLLDNNDEQVKLSYHDTDFGDESANIVDQAQEEISPLRKRRGFILQ